MLIPKSMLRFLSSSQISFLSDFSEKPFKYIHNTLFEDPNLDLPVSYAETLDVDVSWSSSFGFSKKGDTSKKGKIYVLSPKEEQDIFLRYNWFRYKIFKLQEDWFNNQKPALSTKEINYLLSLFNKVQYIESQIDKINAGLKLQICNNFLKKSYNENVFQEIWSAINIAMLTSIRGFNVSLGYKFSTYLYNASSKQVYRETEREYVHKKRFKNISSSTSDDTKFFAFLHRIESPEKEINYDIEKFNSMISFVFDKINVPDAIKMSSIEKFVFVSRYFDGLKLKEIPLTFFSIADEFERRFGRKITRTRIQQIHADAISKIISYFIYESKASKEKIEYVKNLNRTDQETNLIEEEILV